MADDQAHEDPRSLQRAHYARTAERYDGMHPRAEHLTALQHAVRLTLGLGAKSLLDTGCGTGLGMRTLQVALPDVEVRGNDPSQALLDVAVDRYGIDRGRLDCVASERLPYEDGQFDVVIETGMLHHVPEPAAVVAEMLRVARLAVFISDDNHYGSGALWARLAKLGLAWTGLLGFVNRLRRGGHEWHYTPEDGIAWSYSVFDSLPQLARGSRELLVVPTAPAGSRAAQGVPLLFASHCFVAALK